MYSVKCSDTQKYIIRDMIGQLFKAVDSFITTPSNTVVGTRHLYLPWLVRLADTFPGSVSYNYTSCPSCFNIVVMISSKKYHHTQTQNKNITLVIHNYRTPHSMEIFPTVKQLFLFLIISHNIRVAELIFKQNWKMRIFAGNFEEKNLV